MFVPLEHDYIGLSETASVVRSSEKMSSSSSSSSSTLPAGEENTIVALNVKETELRLGLPGFAEELEEEYNNNTANVSKNGYPLTPAKNLVSGAKRGFTDVIDGCGKWVFPVNGRSEADSANRTRQSCLPFGMKEVCIPHPPPSNPVEEKKSFPAKGNGSAPAAKAQVVGWPPIRSFRKNTLSTTVSKNSDPAEGNTGPGCLYVKVSMDGAPYLRKVDLKTCSNYAELSAALKKMFSCFTIGPCPSHGVPGREGLSEKCLIYLLHGSEWVLTYEDKDGDWMLVGDVPWEMFVDSCKRLRIMKGSEAIGLAPRRIGERCKNKG